MRKFIKRLRNERGLTLVELLAVIVILGIIAIIAFVFIGGIIENSKKDAHIANAQQIISAAKLHDATNADFQEINVVGEDSLKAKDYLDIMYDPWTKEEYTDIGGAKVTKEENGEFKIHDFNVDNCSITETEVELTKKDRDEICK